MNVLVTSENRFVRDSANQVWTPSQFPYDFWTRYLDAFDQVTVLARIQDLSQAPQGFARSCGPNVEFHAVPTYLGPWQYLLKTFAIGRHVREAVKLADAAIIRSPSILAGRVREACLEQGKIFGVEVVGDPAQVFTSGAIDHPLRAFFRWRFVSSLKADIRNAKAVAYVTRRVLQGKYPPPRLAMDLDTHAMAEPEHGTSWYSNVVLNESDFVPTSRALAPARESYRVITVGSLEQPYKGVDLLIEAVRSFRDRGFGVELTVVGGGRLLPTLELQASQAGLNGIVRFVGEVRDRHLLKELLDASDVFLLASRTEGLPRALIEAMARALPCLGSRVGGIPELLEEEDLFAPNNSAAIASAMDRLFRDPRRLAAMSARNLARAAEYKEPLLRHRRRRFYSFIRHCAQARAQGGLR